MYVKYTTQAERFWSKVQKSDGCWLWTGCKNGMGYGLYSRKGSKLAHRISYELQYGPIPDDAILCHSCDTPACVRPDHLRPGTRKSNLQEAAAKGRMAQGDQHYLRRNPELKQRGERASSAKLTEAQVLDIRRLYALGTYNYSQLEPLFGVRRHTISSIVRRRTWTHI